MLIYVIKTFLFELKINIIPLFTSRITNISRFTNDKGNLINLFLDVKSKLSKKQDTVRFKPTCQFVAVQTLLSIK